jgi:hypothetical protein
MINGRNRQIHTHELREILGISHTPAEGLAPREVNGVKIWAVPLVPGGTFQLRMRCECPTCGKQMAAGRYAQHAKIHGG